MKELGISPLTALVLASRGLADPAEAHKFLFSGLDDLHDPRLLPDYEKAKDEILGAKERGETIFVHGDYDADGVTSAALFTRFLRSIGAKVISHTPHRFREGYGIHEIAVRMAHDAGAKLFLTCDCGVTAHNNIRYAQELGMRVVVTDHHLPKETLPEAQAVVNPHRKDSQYPFKDLCGVGVVFKLLLGLTEELDIRRDRFTSKFLDLVAIGTVADLMPLVDENRIMVRQGLIALPASGKPGLKALISKACDSSKGVSSFDIGYKIAPRLNAAGRIDDSKLALELLLTSDHAEAQVLADKLEELNVERQSQQALMVEEALAEIEANRDSIGRILVLARQNWPHGILGLVSGRITEHFALPSFVIGYDEGGEDARGSARSVSGFHLGKAIDALAPLITGGGHEAAAGIGLKVKDIDQFRDAVNAYATEICFEPGPPVISVQAEIGAELLTPEAVDDLNRLQPFGTGNSTPRFAVKGFSVDKRVTISNDRHLKICCRSAEGAIFESLIWGQGDSAYPEAQEGTKVNLVFEPQLNTFQGRRTVQLKICDLQLFDA
ncbi:MAG: single-stranded-DNA-specific exonuclease RecJ [Armatimonadetes bacterium]|nr:single-stranded-DNA-specific exonuclease RecJ [Armatimonadota bacterium]